MIKKELREPKETQSMLLELSLEWFEKYKNTKPKDELIYKMNSCLYKREKND